MITKKFVLLMVACSAVLFAVGCNTRTGQGAAVGAAGGAIVGGPVGAAVGAAGGAIVGATIASEEATRRYPAPSGGYPVAKRAASAGMVYSPYTGKLYDVRNVPSGALVLDTDQKKPFRTP